MKTIFVLCDALKSIYLTEENMPFLFSLSKDGYYVKQIIPCPGFCERSEIFSGLDGYDTGNFTAIGYLPESSPYKNDKIILRYFALLQKVNKRIYGLLFNYWRIKKKKILSNYRIPNRSLPLFSLTEDGRKQLIPHRTIFQVLEDKGMSYTMDGFTSLANLKRMRNLSIIEFAKSEIRNKTDFIPIYIGETDSIGHRYGSNIDSIKPTLQKVDSILKEIFQEATNNGYAFCVLGDHGMVPVIKTLDVMAIVEKSGCKLHKDYEAFYDSTMVRLWFYNDSAKKRISLLLKNKLSKFGIFIDETNYLVYRIPLDIKSEDGKPVYGELLWCANPGVLVSPDYFHSINESEKGMHGYIKVVEGHGTGLFVEKFSGVVPFTLERSFSSQVCGELCKLLGIEKPNNKEWKRKAQL